MSGGLYCDVPQHYMEEIKRNYKKGSYKIVDGIVKMFCPAMWFTNLDHKRRREPLILYKKYNPEEYPKYDNYDAINVDKTKEIPYDYGGAMGVPISFLDRHNPDQFELLGIMNTGEKNMGIRHPNTPHGRPIINGQEKYLRVLIRHK